MGTSPSSSDDKDAGSRDADPIDEEAANIDARDEDVPELIEVIREEAQEMGRETPDPSEVEVDGPDIARP